MNLTFLRKTATLAVILPFCTGTAAAATLEWANPGTGGDFFTAGNWSPEQVPANSDSITLGAGASYTVVGSGTHSISNALLGAGAMLNWQSGQLGLDYYGSATNSGTIRFSQNNATWYMWAPGPNEAIKTAVNAGVIEADGITLTWTTRRRTLNNTDGMVRVINGASFIWASGGGISMTGGTYLTDATSSTLLDGVNKNITATGMALVNQGYTYIVERTGGTTGNTQYTGFTGLGSLTNSGTLLMECRSVDTRAAYARVTLGAGSSFANTGTITLDQTTEFPSANVLLQSAASITNAGTINIRNPRALVQVTGTGNTYTQTGTTSATTLANGGAVQATTVNILGGSIGGLGQITGNLGIADGATASFTLRDATPDVIAVTGTASLANGSIVKVALAEGFQPSDGQTFDVISAAGGFTGTTVDSLAFDYSQAVLTGGKTWGDAEIVGEGSQMLRLTVDAAAGGTVLTIR